VTHDRVSKLFFRGRRRALIVTVVVAVVGVALVQSSHPTRAATLIASDTFNRTVSNGWGAADQGGNWTVLDTSSSWSVAPGAGSIAVGANVQQRAVLSSVSAQDVDLLAKVVLPRCTIAGDNCDAYVIGRVVGSGTSPTYYRVGLVQGPSRNHIYIRAQRNDGSNLSSDVDTGLPAADGTTAWLRVEFQGANPTNIVARAWADGATEPSAWLLNINDSTAAEQTAGAVGIRAKNEDTSGAHSFQYQSFVATALSTPPTSTTSTTNTSSTSSSSTTTSIPTTTGTAASDSFQRTVSSGWGNADTGGLWTVVGSPWNWSVSPGAGTVPVAAGAQELAYLSHQTTQDVDITEQVTMPRCATSCDAFVLGRYSPAFSPTYYRVGLIQSTGRSTIFIRTQRSDGSTIGGDLDTHLAASDGAKVLLHVEFLGVNPTVLRARAWFAGTTEPTTWMLNTSDSTAAEQTAGMVGVRFRNEDGTAAHTFNVQSYQATGTSTPVSVTPNPAGPAHLLYVPDDPVDGAHAAQVSVYDIDNGFGLVKQFPVPEAGKRGVAAAPNQGVLYIAECGTGICGSTAGSLLAYDLVHDVVKWVANYPFGVDQLAVTQDGSTIYMPNGLDSTTGVMNILDAGNGRPTGTINVGFAAHNTIASLDGTKVFLTAHNSNTGDTLLTATNQIVSTYGPTINGFGPYTVNGKNTLLFTSSSYTCGFQVLSLVTGQVLYTVSFSGSCSWQTNSPSHGVSLSPDEKRLYVMDDPVGQLQVYDVSGVPNSAPVFVKSVALSTITGNETPCQSWCAKEGWALADLSGRYVFVGDSGDVIDTSTLTVVGHLPALQNTRQEIEIDWGNGAVSATSTRFGLGHVTS
jgi:DNA-binding beta-propeller fold protein YncE